MLELPLSAIQVPWLIDELDELRGPLEEDLQRARASGDGGDEDLGVKEYELRLPRLMRARLPSHAADQAVQFVGPSGMVETVVLGVVRNVASAVSELAASRPPDAAALRATAQAVAAWATTLVECLDVVEFNFDPDADPQRSW